MSTDRINQTLTQAIEQLSAGDSLQGIFHQHREGDPLPSSKALGEIIELSRTILFPGYFGKSTVNSQTIKYHIGVNIERLHKLLTDQIMAGLCFNRCDCNVLDSDQEQCRTAAKSLATLLIERFPKIIPRIITEMAHSETGIDIHPAATIGDHFTIDHGTGVVIGATCIIGNNVKLYQGVTLGAKSFPLDENGNPIKGIPRHPIIEDNVVIYANATILGRITIGKNSVVGANVWVTQNLAPNTKKYKQVKSDNIDFEYLDGGGI